MSHPRSHELFFRQELKSLGRTQHRDILKLELSLDVALQNTSCKLRLVAPFSVETVCST